MQHRVSGLDEFTAFADAASAFVCLLLLAACGVFLGIPINATILLGLCLLPFLLLLAAGARYRCTLSAQKGLLLEKYRFWFWRVMRQEFFLDASFQLYISGDASRAQGLCLVSPRPNEDESDFFGPYFGSRRMKTLQHKLQEMLESTRRGCPVFEQTALQNSLLADQQDRIDLENAVFSHTGRLALARNALEVKVGTITLPPETLLLFNPESYIDPRREDFLFGAVCGGAVDLEFCDLQVRPGAKLQFDSVGRVVFVHEGFENPIAIGPKTIDNQNPLGFSMDGELVQYTLAQEFDTGRFILPSGSTVQLLPKEYRSRKTAGVACLGGNAHVGESAFGEGEVVCLSQLDRVG